MVVIPNGQHRMIPSKWKTTCIHSDAFTAALELECFNFSPLLDFYFLRFRIFLSLYPPPSQDLSACPADYIGGIPWSNRLFSKKSLVILGLQFYLSSIYTVKLINCQFTEFLHACIRHNQNLAGLHEENSEIRIWRKAVWKVRTTEKFISHDKA